MRFKTDENLPAEIVTLLCDHGHDAISVVEQQLAGAPDNVVAKVCQSEQRVLVTLDLDFADIRAYPPDEYSGIIVCSPQGTDNFRDPPIDGTGDSPPGKFVTRRKIVDSGRVSRSNPTEVVFSISHFVFTVSHSEWDHRIQPRMIIAEKRI